MRGEPAILRSANRWESVRRDAQGGTLWALRRAPLRLRFRRVLRLPANLSSSKGAALREVLLEAQGISKGFAGVQALVRVDFDLRRGEVHALVGENGAGKSTLMKILAGVHVEYGGVVRLAGAPVRFAGVQDAERAGVAIIHQELDLVPELTAADNIFLGREPLIAGLVVDRRRMVKTARALLRRLGVDIDPQTRVAELRVGEQQLVEIAKALSLDARILMMDEPTSALSAAECETLFKVVRQLAAAGVAIIFTSHRIGEVVALADRVTVLRDGKWVLTAPIQGLTLNAIISSMVGREFVSTEREFVEAKGQPVLSVRNLTLDTVSVRGWRRVLNGVNFELRPGEILGIGGLLGSGRSEILEFDFRRRARLGWGRDPDRRTAGGHQFANRRLQAGCSAGDRGSKGSRIDPRFDGSRQCGASLGRCAVAVWPSRFCARSHPRGGHNQAPDRALQRRRADRLDSIGRQPAENRHRQVARHRA